MTFSVIIAEVAFLHEFGKIVPIIPSFNHVFRTSTIISRNIIRSSFGDSLKIYIFKDFL